MKIYASNSNISLLDQDKRQVKEIGYTTEKQKWLIDGTCVDVTEVCFDYGTGQKDCFYFEQGELAYHVVSAKREDYIIALYKELIKAGISPSELINEITAAYTFTELGF